MKPQFYWKTLGVAAVMVIAGVVAVLAKQPAGWAWFVPAVVLVAMALVGYAKYGVRKDGAS